MAKSVLRIAAEESNAREQAGREERKREMDKLAQQLQYAQQELKGAILELKRTNDIQEEAKYEAQAIKKGYGEIVATNLQSEIEWDKPKSSRNYIPETSYVTGYTLGGIVVSTALNTPDENATPVVIRLSSRGNLPKNIGVDISTCRILGSSYGDLSSERVIIRVEKLVCIDPKTELVTISDIVGTIHGDDGMNGIKGKVVATSNKHIKNAFVGGIIGGLASSAKGQEGLTLTSLGAVGTKKQGFGTVAGQGALTGVSNAGDKIADYYLRLAEQMSPVLTVPGGVKVDVIFTKGFFLGELGIRKKLSNLRNTGKNTRGNEYE
jgi:conjugal transfer pilus assembly protein TraB